MIPIVSHKYTSAACLRNSGLKIVLLFTIQFPPTLKHKVSHCGLQLPLILFKGTMHLLQSALGDLLFMSISQKPYRKLRNSEKLMEALTPMGVIYS